MGSVTPSLDYFVPRALRTRSDDDRIKFMSVISLLATVTGDVSMTRAYPYLTDLPSNTVFLLLYRPCVHLLYTLSLRYPQVIPSRYMIWLKFGTLSDLIICFIWNWTLLPPFIHRTLCLGFLIMLRIMIITVELSFSSSSITVDIGLESSDSTDWPHLTPDLAFEIVNRLTTFRDYIAAKGVNRDWRSASAFSSNSFQLPLPALLLSEPLLTDMRTLFSLYDYSRHRLQLSEVHGKRIWGSQRGWVATLGSHYGTQLVHLMTGSRINLPQIQRLAPQEEWFCLVHKFTLLKDPTDESTFLVFAIFGPMNSLAFTRVRVEEGPALNRIGEGEWVVVGNPENLKFKDVEHFNGQIYALCDNGKLVRFEADAPLADMVQVIADHPQDAGAHRKVYLVESLGYLYGVHRIGCLIPSERRFETISFVVYKFNFNASAWEEVTHLEGQAFFVGDGNSFSWRFPTSTIPSRSNSIYFTWLFRTSTIPSRSNCIYFTDDWWDWQMDPRIQAFGGHDVGVFDMASGLSNPLHLGLGRINLVFILDQFGSHVVTNLFDFVFSNTVCFVVEVFWTSLVAKYYLVFWFVSRTQTNFQNIYACDAVI